MLKPKLPPYPLTPPVKAVPVGQTPKAVPPPWKGLTHKNLAEYREIAAKKKSDPKDQKESSDFHPGIAAPPAWILGSTELVEQWRGRNCQEALKALCYKPESNSINVAGRPVQLLIVTHPGAPAREWDSYFRFCLRPLKPIYLLGVTGGEEPAEDVLPAHAVIQWWKAFVSYNMDLPSVVALLSFACPGLISSVV